LREARDAILALPQVPSTVWREVEIRRATGETQKLRRLSVEQTLDSQGLEEAGKSRPGTSPLPRFQWRPPRRK
jgi:hypothetical protein